ncbi:MAG TPA: toll/interleukin-1 receptor domain-containing protein [Candidatus Udaeobacter sp.]|nr:toll/interleukin-1 receptor domain-containing protein [Candidatus Udaeobacter sp.]
MEPLKIFYSYAHEDRTLRAELGKHLANCRSQRLCQDWSDGDIVPGDDWDAEIKDKLRTSDIILLLISADFLNSKYVESVEIREAMQRHQAAEARVIPIILRACDYSGALFSKIQGLPTDMQPVASWPNQDEAWSDVVRGLKATFAKFRESSNGAESVPPGSIDKKSSPLEVSKPNEGLNQAQEENRALAATSTESFQGLSELMANPKIKEFVADEADQLLEADKRLQVLVDYKNVHDRLHDLQFKCYNYLFQECRKVEDEIDWPLLDRPEKDLAKLTEALQGATQRPSLAEEDFGWLETLREAGKQLSVACNELSIAPLQEATRIIRTILEVRPTIFDVKLCAAARTLPLAELRTALGAIRGKIGPASIRSDAGKRFSAGVDALPQLSANLETLTTEHTRWQVIATSFWSIDALIDKSIDALRNSWPKLRGRLERICAGNPARWAVSILASANKLDALFAAPSPLEAKEVQHWQTRVRQTYTSCSNDSGTQFYQVDLSLKRFCDELRDLHTALAKVLKELP